LEWCSDEGACGAALHVVLSVLIVVSVLVADVAVAAGLLGCC